MPFSRGVSPSNVHTVRHVPYAFAMAKEYVIKQGEKQIIRTLRMLLRMFIFFDLTQ